MAGYSGTPLAKKLGVKADQRVVLIDAPPSFLGALEPLPSDLSIASKAGREPIDLVVIFCPDRAALVRHFKPLAGRLTPAGALWVAWPKKASGVSTDLTENVVRDIGLGAGLVDNKVCAIDETWSGLRFVFRRKDRPGLRS